MKRIDKIRTMPTESIAKLIIDKLIIDAYCTGRFQGQICDDCLNELECCLKWLEEEKTDND